MHCYAIYRDERFSPNSVERDKAIMDAVCARLSPEYHITKVAEKEVCTSLKACHEEHPLILSMARSREALTVLLLQQRQGARILNRPDQLLKQSRSTIDRLMRENGIPCAPLQGTDGWWIKRGDEAAQEKGDVMFAADASDRDRITMEFRRRGITDIVTTAHVAGDLVKFYGVNGTDFFHITYPTDSGFSKFGDEQRNGTPLYTPFDETALKRHATQLATLTGIDIYGGDCIVRADGSYAVIDFNDWPSFSACREEAADAIAGRAQDNTFNN